MGFQGLCASRVCGLGEASAEAEEEIGGRVEVYWFEILLESIGLASKSGFRKRRT
jgi:hypothetical protein